MDSQADESGALRDDGVAETAETVDAIGDAGGDSRDSWPLGCPTAVCPLEKPMSYSTNSGLRDPSAFDGPTALPSSAFTGTFAQSPVSL